MVELFYKDAKSLTTLEQLQPIEEKQGLTAMRKIIVLSVLVLVILSGCSDQEAELNSSLNGTWRVVSFDNLASGTSDYKTFSNSWDKDIVITFDDAASPKQFSGTLITNTIFGEFEYVNREGFKINTLRSTEVNQPVWADQFIVAITDQDPTFKNETERLKIYYAGATRSVTLVKN